MEIERTVAQWSLGSSRVKWSAIFAGWAVGLATQMVLMLLGLAIGAWSIDFRDAQSSDGVPMGTAVWTGLSMLASAFTGGYVAARLSGSPVRSDGIYHGAVVWGVNWLVFAWLTTTAMAYVVGGLFTAFGSTVQSVSQGVGSAAGAALSKVDASAVSLSPEQLRQQVESVLQSTGKQELQPGEMRKDAERMSGAAKEGQPPQAISDAALSELQQKLSSLDREAAVNVMVNKLGMTNEQAQQLVQSTIGILAPLKQKAQEVKEQSAQLGTDAVKHIGTMAMWLFGLAIITLGLTIAGGMAGTPDHTMMESYMTSYADLRRTA
jgi:hypothetical protein